MQSDEPLRSTPGGAQRPTSAESPTRTEELADQIRGDIATGAHGPGNRLTEKALSEQYGMSRTPVREALRTLVQESLLEYAPNRGYRVTRLQLRDLDDLYAIRVAIEQQVTHHLASGVGDLARVRELLVIWEVPAPPAHASLVFADEAFHEGLAAAAGGSVLHDELVSINRRIHALRVREFVDPARVVRTYQQHADILRAVLAGDGVLAAALMGSHILEGRQFVRASAIANDLVDYRNSSVAGGGE